MRVHVRHFGWLQDVVPDCSVLDGNLVQTIMSLTFLTIFLTNSFYFQDESLEGLVDLGTSSQVMIFRMQCSSKF